MSLSDCTECWSTPCLCGHDYKDWSESRKNELVRAIQGFVLDDFIKWVQTDLESGEMDMYQLITSSPEYLTQRFKRSKDENTKKE